MTTRLASTISAKRTAILQEKTTLFGNDYLEYNYGKDCEKHPYSI